MIKQIILILIVVWFMVPDVMAANDSMDVDDMKNTKPSIPFGASFFTMVIAFSKWIAFFGFIVGLSIILGKGPIASAINNANMKHETQEGLYFIIKILLLGAVVYIAGVYIFETYL